MAIIKRFTINHRLLVVKSMTTTHFKPQCQTTMCMRGRRSLSRWRGVGSQERKFASSCLHDLLGAALSDCWRLYRRPLHRWLVPPRHLSSSAPLTDSHQNTCSRPAPLSGTHQDTCSRPVPLTGTRQDTCRLCNADWHSSRHLSSYAPLTGTRLDTGRRCVTDWYPSRHRSSLRHWLAPVKTPVVGASLTGTRQDTGRRCVQFFVLTWPGFRFDTNNSRTEDNNCETRQQYYKDAQQNWKHFNCPQPLRRSHAFDFFICQFIE